MHFNRKAAIAALLAASVGVTAMTPAAFAQGNSAQKAPGFEQGTGQFRAHDRHEGMRNGFDGGLVDLVCSDQGAERLEIAFVRLSHRVALTAEQTPLFEALKTAALTAQTSFSDTCKSALPAAGANAAKPDLVERLKTSLKLDEARIAALAKLLPPFEAFYGSLTADQKAKLDMPRFGMHDQFDGMHSMMHGMMHDQMRGPGAPGDAGSN